MNRPLPTYFEYGESNASNSESKKRSLLIEKNKQKKVIVGCYHFGEHMKSCRNSQNMMIDT